jgi:hypothetical protein
MHYLLARLNSDSMFMLAPNYAPHDATSISVILPFISSHPWLGESVVEEQSNSVTLTNPVLFINGAPVITHTNPGFNS